MAVLENEQFLVELGQLFTSCKEKGSVWITYKRCNFLIFAFVLSFCFDIQCL